MPAWERPEPVVWRIRGTTLTNTDHTLVMGVVNTTPDSFSDGGRWSDPESAITHGRALLAAGADVVDVGGESTRPGADPVAVSDELRRVVPVVRALADAGAVVSIDTSKAEVAAAAVEAGARIVNDVTALADPDMAAVVAGSGAGVVLMHMLGTPRTMQRDPRYGDVVAEVREFLEARATLAAGAGIDPEAICIDPGIGFGKSLEHNLSLLAGTAQLAATGYPVLVGASRKSFLAGILGDLSMAERDVPSAAAHVLAIAGGAAMIRVHEVVTGLRTARVADAIVRTSGGIG